jgi:hypothetical protein
MRLHTLTHLSAYLKRHPSTLTSLVHNMIPRIRRIGVAAQAVGIAQASLDCAAM